MTSCLSQEEEQREPLHIPTHPFNTLACLKMSGCQTLLLSGHSLLPHYCAAIHFYRTLRFSSLGTHVLAFGQWDKHQPRMRTMQELLGEERGLKWLWLILQ